MSALTISVAHNNARLAATLAFADSGPLNSRIELYTAADVLLATVVLAKPCATLTADKLVLEQESATGDMVVADGTATYGRWINGNGVLVGLGAVTDDAGAGPFKIAGANGTTLYAGGFVVLGTTEVV